MVELSTRTVVALGLLVVLVGLSGCTGLFGTGEVKPAKLSGNATYDWDRRADTTYVVNRTQYRAVIRVNATLLMGDNSSQLRLYKRNTIGTERPINLKALRFRYPNGTVVNATAFEVRKTRTRAIVEPPGQTGQIAYTAPRPAGKRFSVPLFLEGSHKVILPPQARAALPLLSQISPGADEKTVRDNRLHIYWESIERGPIVARYYLQRDLLLFGALFAILATVAIGGALYYLRRIKLLERRREEIGLDVETEDDDLDDGGPPPGMK